MTYPSSNAAPEGGPFYVGSDGLARLVYPAPMDIPTNQIALKSYIDQRFQVTGGPVTELQVAGTLLAEDADPQVRSALFQFVKSLPGISVAENAVDGTGESGTGIAVQVGGNTSTLIFDPRSSRVLGFIVTTDAPTDQLGESVPSGTILDYTNFSEPVVLGSTSQLPN